MAESKNQKDKRENEDIKFDRDELLSTDPEVSDLAREKRNKAMPEQFRSDPSKLSGWPVTEDKLPAVMPADKESDHDYQLETYKEVPEEARDVERDGRPGDVARAEMIKLNAKLAREGGDANEVQAPPSRNAQLAAEGEGAPNTPIPAQPVAQPPVAAVAPAKPAPKK
jgi:hypothetical protein